MKIGVMLRTRDHKGGVGIYSSVTPMVPTEARAT